jgi:hypothetical protein
VDQPPISLSAYAGRRGVTPKAVSKAVAAGRLVASIGRDARGQPVVLDPDLADREWEANTRQRADRAARESASGAGSAAPAPPESEDLPAPAPRARRVDLPEGVPVYHVSQAIRAHHAARQQAAAADQAELDLAARRGQLVDAAAARADVFARISMAKTRLLGVPTLVGQDAPDVAARIVPLIERRIREAIEELSDDGRGA